MKPRYFDDADVAAALSIPETIARVDRAFRLLADGLAVNSVRQRSNAGSATINVMWAIAPTEGVLGVKEYTTIDGKTRGVVLTLLLHSSNTGELLAVIRADHLGQLRTAAASAVATRILARPDSQVLSVYGTGFQAEWQVRFLAYVLPDLRMVHVVGRNPAKQDAFVARLRNSIDVPIAATDARTAAESADVVVTATAAAEPVLRGEWVRSGTHINAIGSNIPTHRELDRTLLDRAQVIIVDDRTVAGLECGDLLANDFPVTRTYELGDVLLGRAVGRTASEDITIFESQGLALQDVLCAAALVNSVP